MQKLPSYTKYDDEANIRVLRKNGESKIKFGHNKEKSRESPQEMSLHYNFLSTEVIFQFYRGRHLSRAENYGLPYHCDCCEKSLFVITCLAFALAHWKSLASGKTSNLKACLIPPKSLTFTTAKLSNSYRQEYLNLEKIYSVTQ